MHAVDPRSRARSEGHHAFRCGCGFEATSTDPRSLVAFQEAHTCPASTWDVIADRLITRRGLVALLVVIVTIAATITLGALATA